MTPVERFARSARWRLGADALMRRGAWALCAALGVATALVVAERLLAVGVAEGAAVVLPLAVMLALALGVSVARWPREMAAAVATDQRLRLDERLSSALAAGEGAMADLVREDAARHLDGVSPAEAFPLRWPAVARLVPLLGAALVLALLVPELDLLGIGEARRLAAARGGGLGVGGRPAQGTRTGPGTGPRIVQVGGVGTGTAVSPDTRQPAGLGPARPSTRDAGVGEPRASDAFVREAPALSPSPKLTALVEGLAAARAAAEEAMARDAVPWRYRGVVQRYFSPDGALER